MTARVTRGRNRALVAFGLVIAIAAMLLAQQLGGGRADAAPVAKSAAKKGYSLTSKSFQIARPNDGQRLTVLCPGKSEPLGGGMRTDPPAADGEGIYPHSYERLGRQSGYHISVILYDPSPAQTETRTVTLQVLCGPKYGKVSPPHTTLDLGPSDASREAIAKCPGKRYLIGGGYQRTNFTNAGGILATESQAISAKSWRVSALGLGKFGGQATSIGYCVRTKKPPLRTVTATVPVPGGQFATATTPQCPKKRELAFGGFSTPPNGSVLSTGGSFKSNGSWTVGGYNTSSGDASITAYGYCLRV